MTANHISWLLQTIEDPEIAKRFIESRYKKSRISYDPKLDISRQVSHINLFTDEAPDPTLRYTTAQSFVFNSQ